MGIPLHIHYYQALHLMSTLKILFINILRTKNGIISGYDNADGLFTLTFTVTKSGNGYINGKFDCGGLLTTPN
ncbi:MAG: hypothetical protein ACKPKO_20600, partial [Candidatus Fonsibacter sp.]